MVETTVSKGQNGQYKTTIPKGLGDGHDLDGAKVEWEVKSRNRIEMVVKREK